MSVLQAYEKLGPEARRLHREYLDARRAWHEAGRRHFEAEVDYRHGRGTREQMEAAGRAVEAAYNAMKAAQASAAHAERDPR